MRWLERILWLLVAALVGVGIGLSVFRPWQPRTSPVLAIASASAPTGAQPTPSAPHPTAVPSAINCSTLAVQKTISPTTIPRDAWVHASDGVNVRATPSQSAARLTTLAVGTSFLVQDQQTNPDGSTWVRLVLDDGRTGWVNSQFITNYAITKAVSDDVTIWLPQGYTLRTAGVGMVESRWAGASLDFMFVQTGITGQGSTLLAEPTGLPARSSWKLDHEVQVLVGDHPEKDSVFRVNLGSCEALVNEIFMETPARDYMFLFITDRNTVGVVAEVLDSATVR